MYLIVLHISQLMAKAVDELAAVTPGKESRAMEAFANALRQVRDLPTTSAYPASTIAATPTPASLLTTPLP